MPEVNFTLRDILTLRRALNALVVRQELNSLSASESMKEEISATLLELHDLGVKLLQLKPECSRKQ